MESRVKAARAIEAGMVRVDDAVADKPGALYKPEAEIQLLEDPSMFVSRGGDKLKAALDHFRLNVEGKNAMDIGASTGGFTDCLLKHGADNVLAVDVGYGLIHETLRQDARVHLLERQNARYLEPKQIPFKIDLVTIDVSFISLRIILARLFEILPKFVEYLTLVKPQFEAGKKEVPKSGVIKDPSIHKRVLTEISDYIIEQGHNIIGSMQSPIRGAKGNIEFFLYFR